MGFVNIFFVLVMSLCFTQLCHMHICLFFEKIEFFSIFILCWIAHRLQKNPTNKCVSKSKLANSNVRPKIYFLASSMFTIWGSQTLQVGTQINDDNVIFLYLTFEFAIIDLLYFLFLFRKKIFSKFLILYWKHLTDSVRVHTCTHVHFLT